MNFKIITLAENQTQICLHRDRSEDGKEIVRISAFVNSAAGTEPMLEHVASFSNVRSAQSFVNDYSEDSARGFLMQSLREERIVPVGFS